ncbi:ATP F0F1 synthase subunit B [Pinisolibacter aquiterrae]|uniref:F0F1 ATP synthase subunit B family protein n=1 Tax=Pinisolibacter aquiterrae TaxID=2815579 RepID=UPI001C3C79C9|nr:ATP F0F1 synthase subunit B [Pinisolibacter aquiterrae]MBV5266519.1 ATP F0F1 synthase subunit B [Pinisolibacter aquiterrae]MCC8234600.1 ATP F0F1 synthase subunit B [Pinisolibacter aquiterrae]
MDATSLASLWAFVSLLIFFGVIVYLKVPAKIGAALDGKVDAIKAELDEAKRLREEAAELLAAYKKKAADAELEAQSIVAEAKTQAELATVEAEKALSELIERRTKSAESKIAQAEAQAVAEVRSRAADLAVAAAEKILVNRTAGVAGADLVAKGIAEVGAKLN